MKYKLFLFLIIFQSIYSQADLTQMEVIDTPVLLETEIVAKRLPDSRYCAGIKILSDLDGFSYDSYLGVMGVEDKPGQDIVYLDPKERALLVYHTAYSTLTIILSESGIQLQPRQLWVIRIKGGKVDILPVSFVVTPANAEIYIDGKLMKKGPTFQINKLHFLA